MDANTEADVVAPMGLFPFAGWKNFFFGDLHIRRKDAVGC
jgi:hypothetical protein